jgi:hypothetical protein
VNAQPITSYPLTNGKARVGGPSIFEPHDPWLRLVNQFEQLIEVRRFGDDVSILLLRQRSRPKQGERRKSMSARGRIGRASE